MLTPKCCGSKMEVTMENGKFIEVKCGQCGDVVYVKKGEILEPQMLDD